MGAAIALQATRTTPGLCAVVAEAPFISFREIGYERIGQGLHSGVGFARAVAWLAVEFGFLQARVRYGLDFDGVNPAEALANSHVPALVIVGLRDDNIPPRHGREIAGRAGGVGELWEVAGAGHTAAASVEPVEFRRRVLGWLDGHRMVKSDMPSARASDRKALKPAMWFALGRQMQERGGFCGLPPLPEVPGKDGAPTITAGIKF
jgi:pimeloyl-ACP methyl ester carboxylesterase